MNGDMFNALSAMKQSEKPSGWHKIRGKGFKTKQKIKLVCEVPWCISSHKTACSLCASCQKGLMRPRKWQQGGSKLSDTFHTMRYYIQKEFPAGKINKWHSGEAGSRGVEGPHELHCHPKRCQWNASCDLHNSKIQKTQPVCQSGLKQADKGNTSPCYTQWSLRPHCYRQLWSLQICLDSKETRQRGCLVKINQAL